MKQLKSILVFYIIALVLIFGLTLYLVDRGGADIKPKLVLGLFEARDQSGAIEFEQKLRLELQKRGLNNKFSTIEIVTEYGPYLPSIDEAAKRLVLKNPDILVAITTTNAVSLSKVTKKIPIVFHAYRDPVVLGLVDSLASPGKNLTGTSFFLPLHLKRWELLKELSPNIKRIGVLLDSQYVPANLLEDIALAQRVLKLDIVPIYVPEDSDLQYLHSLLKRDGIDALDLPQLGHLVMRQTVTAEHIRKLNVLTSYEGALYCEWGGHLCFARQNIPIESLFADYIAILANGGRPQSTPMSTPTTFDFVLNVTALKALNIVPSASMLARATIHE